MAGKNGRDVATYTIIKLLSCFLVCYLPGGIMRFIFLINTFKPGIFGVIVPTNPAGRERFFYSYILVNLVLVSLNSMLNPFMLIPNTNKNARRSTKIVSQRQAEMTV